MSPSTELGFVLSAHVFRFCLCSYGSFIWCHGLVYYLLFPKSCSPVSLLFRVQMAPSSRIGLGFYQPMIVDFVCVFMSLSNSAMGWSVICYSPVVLTHMFAPFRAKMSSSSRMMLGFLPICFIDPSLWILLMFSWLFQIVPWVGLYSVIS